MLRSLALVLLLFLPGGADDLAALAESLEFSPDDTSLLAEMAQACADAGRKDEAIWYAGLALDGSDPKRDKKTVAALNALIESVQPGGVDDGKAFEEYTEGLFRAAQNCQRRKLYANAVDLLSRVRGTRFDKRAGEKLAKLFKDQKAVQGILDSGIDVPERPTTKKSPEWIARQDKKHVDFEDAYEIKGKYYTVQTNMGYEMAHSIALAMGQMNGFYRKVFGYKERGGSMRRCVLKVYARRTEFDEYEDMADKPGVKGFFRPTENSVTTYDPRTEQGGGRAISKLWSTLFHEASHQFIRAATSGNQLPGWLNEGTASYFEGAELLPSGLVATNGIPESRLRNLHALILRGSPTVRDVVSYFQPGSYDGSYYPFGWGLMYYFRNYEDENSERIYLPIYADYLESYTSGGNHDVFGRFIEYFVDRAQVPGVDSYGTFVAHWEKWIGDLYAMHFGGPEQADPLIERARKQRSNGKLEYAIESYRLALRKREDMRARFELAETLAEAEQNDGAMYAYREVIAAARASQASGALPGFEGDRAAVEAACVEAMAKIDRNIAEALVRADRDFSKASVEAARGLVEAGLPRAGLRIVETAEAVLGGDVALAELASEIRTNGGIDLRRWRRPTIEDGLESWSGGGEWRAEDGTVVLDADRLTTLVHADEMPARYRYEAWVEPGKGGDFPVYGLVFGSNLQTGMRMFALLPENDLMGLVAMGEKGPEVTEHFGSIPETEDPVFQLAIEVSGRDVEFFFNDERIGKAQLERRELAGGIGLIGQATEARFSELRVRY